MSASRLLIYAASLLLVAAAGCACAADAATTPARPAGQANPASAPPADPAASSYSLGLYMGSQMHASGLQGTVSLEQLKKGLSDGLAGKVATEDDKARMAQMLRDGRQAIAAHNRAQAQQFLAQNAKATGVVTTDSGLQYVIIKPGDPKGLVPSGSDRVTVHYRGRLLDGTQFDSSDSHPIPATFRLNGGMLKGWQEALRMMKPGAQWRLFVPPDLAYGDSGPAQIPPGSLLVFDLELVKIEAPEPMPMTGRELAIPPGAAPGSPAH
ncbi:MAG: FKBP-type peptidyl-prolyl cis-trans isomerase [Proteobacteria bacterium]|nr:FKBP-type peptidyl-prolyl cis-trans isomerase [Pseudomonadota bacterium]